MGDIIIKQEELVGLLKTAYEEGWSGYREMSETVAEKIFQDFIISRRDVLLSEDRNVEEVSHSEIASPQYVPQYVSNMRMPEYQIDQSRIPSVISFGNVSATATSVDLRLDHNGIGTITLTGNITGGALDAVRYDTIVEQTQEEQGERHDDESGGL